MVHPPSDFMTFVEHQLRVRFIMQFFAETWKEGPTLQELMATFGVGQLGTLLNCFFFPMGLSLHRQTLPPFDQMHEHWVSWDYRLRPDQRVALVICDLALFRAMAHMASTDLMDFVDLRPHRRYGLHYEETTLTLHLRIMKKAKNFIFPPIFFDFFLMFLDFNSSIGFWN